MTQTTRNRSDSKTQNCTEDGCTSPLRAMGRCVNHYNAHRYGPDKPRHIKLPTACDHCGAITMKEARRSSSKRYCTYACRSAAMPPRPVKPPRVAPSAPLSCAVPATHPSRRARKPAFFAGMCVECGAGYVIASACVSISRYCSTKCARRVHRRSRRASERGASGSFTWDAFVKLTIKLGNVCAYCGTDNNGQPFQPDHVVPLSRHGHDGLTNILPACAPCNGSKSNKLTREWERHQTADSPPRRFDVLRFPHLTAVDYQRHH